MDETTPLTPGRRTLEAGRYVLQGLLGQGGMADVELAHDTRLDRQVAVKLLHARYADDPAFLARFEREARAAGSLNHPNVVAVYDTGEELGRPWIVMEYVPGRTLREIMRREGLLPERAAEIAADAALALHAAHERGLVHRDVKPANIMVTDSGQVKVADFGIARAVNAETVTQTAMVFGTAAYIAPEQAQGNPVDARTDLYALGCVLFEMVTGRQPFEGENAVALAYKHISEDPIAPRRLNPEVSLSLEAVILKAMAKDPRDRYQSGREMAADLHRAAAGEPVAAGATVPLQRQATAAYAATQALPRDAAPTQALTREQTTVYDDRPPPVGGRTAGYVVLVLLVLGIFAGGGYLVFRLTQAEPPPVTKQVPNLVGQDAIAAQNVLRNEGFNVVFENSADPAVAENQVISTDPPAGTQAPVGTTVTLVVSSGAPLVAIPPVAGLLQDEAVAALTAATLMVADPVVLEPSEEVELGRVIRAEPAEGEQVPSNQPVVLVVSSGPPPVVVPDVVALELDGDDAVRLLERACEPQPCFVVIVVREPDAEPGTAVIDQDPLGGTEVPRGSQVTITVPDLEEEPSPTPSPEPTTQEPTPDPTPEPTTEEPTPEPTTTIDPTSPPTLPTGTFPTGDPTGDPSATETPTA